MNEVQIINDSQTMTLKEITDLLSVRHNDAMRIVEKMAESPEFGELRRIRSSYKNNFGAELPLETYSLDKRQSIAVSARLNTALLMRVVDRWHELEAAQAISIPTDYPSALRLAADLAEKNAKLTEKNNFLAKQLDNIEDKLFDEREELLILQTMLYQGAVH